MKIKVIPPFAFKLGNTIYRMGSEIELDEKDEKVAKALETQKGKYVILGGEVKATEGKTKQVTEGKIKTVSLPVNKDLKGIY